MFEVHGRSARRAGKQVVKDTERQFDGGLDVCDCDGGMSMRLSSLQVNDLSFFVLHCEQDLSGESKSGLESLRSDLRWQ